MVHRGDLPAAIAGLESARAILSTVPEWEPGLNLELRLCRLNALALAMTLAGDHDQAHACLRELVAITESLGEHRYRSYALWAQALANWRQGRADEAVALLGTSLRLKRAPGSTDRYGTAGCLELMAAVAAGRRQYRRAATLLGAADSLWRAIGASVITLGHLAGLHEAGARETRAGLGEAAFADAFARGQALSYDDAIGHALDEERRPATPPAGDALAPLTRREREVAGLIARGLANKEIAAALVISQRTAESHVEHILTKLGCAGRGQVAAWVAAERATDRHP